LEKKYDVVIIGSGMGGLVSSVLMAKEGYKVCVLEKNNQYGGNLQTFVRDKTIFDTGVHYIGGLEEGQNLYQYFKYIGIMDDLRIKRMDLDAYDYVTFDNDDNKYPHAQGYENFVNQLLKFFPNEKETLERYCAEVQRICDSFPLYNLETGTAYDEKTLSINAKNFFDELTDNEMLKAVLSGSNSLYGGNGETTPLYVHALSVNSYIQSAWRCVNGGSQLSKLLVKQLRKYGGEIFKHQEVTSFKFQESILTGAETKKGDIYYADKFISNVDLKATIKMVGADRFRKSFYKRIERLAVTPAAFSVYIVFEPETFPYLNHNYYHFKDKKMVWSATDYDPKNWPEGYMLSMGVNSEDQKWAESMTAMTYMHFSEVEQWAKTKNTVAGKEDRGPEYEKFKEDHIESFLKELELKFPDIRSCIRSVHASTPLSYRDYIGGQEGNMYGYEKDSDNPMKTFISAKTKIPNLFLTGQSINMHGMLGVTIGGVVTCSEILGKDYLINKINSEVNEEV
jgi:all-trans-retinol 13,14-reductase